MIAKTGATISGTPNAIDINQPFVPVLTPILHVFVPFLDLANPGASIAQQEARVRMPNGIPTRALALRGILRRYSADAVHLPSSLNACSDASHAASRTACRT